MKLLAISKLVLAYVCTDGYGATVTVEMGRDDHYSNSRADFKRKREGNEQPNIDVSSWERGAVYLTDVTAASLRDRALNADGKKCVGPGKINLVPLQVFR
jgi:hypothetical protein